MTASDTTVLLSAAGNGPHWKAVLHATDLGSRELDAVAVAMTLSSVKARRGHHRGKWEAHLRRDVDAVTFTVRVKGSNHSATEHVVFRDGDRLTAIKSAAAAATTRVLGHMTGTVDAMQLDALAARYSPTHHNRRGGPTPQQHDL